ncbi:MAG: phosphatase PAP2 family protein [Sphingomonadaceae bacterium]
MAEEKDIEGEDLPQGTANPVERADKALLAAVAPYKDEPAVEAIGKFGEIADQPPLVALSAATLAAGVLDGDARLANAGGRMLAAHLLATFVKDRIKARVNRTRPHVLLEQGRYEWRLGGSEDGDWQSFPSGHTAGAVAVARALARDYPGLAAPAYLAAATAAAIQVPRCKHYASDLAAGAAIGLLAEAAVDLAARALGERLGRAEGEKAGEEWREA